jgi:hypothetical protein
MSSTEISVDAEVLRGDIRKTYTDVSIDRASRHAETGWPTPRSARSWRSASDLASGPPTAARVVSLMSASLGSA